MAQISITGFANSLLVKERSGRKATRLKLSITDPFIQCVNLNRQKLLLFCPQLLRMYRTDILSNEKQKIENFEAIQGQHQVKRVSTEIRNASGESSRKRGSGPRFRWGGLIFSAQHSLV